MSTSGTTNQHVRDGSRVIDRQAAFYDHHHGLESSSYTAEKLRHASPSHLHMTNRRFFIGPIPKGWLQNHRKSWYKKRLKLINYASKCATFSAEEPVPPTQEPEQLSDIAVPDASDGNRADGEQEYSECETGHSTRRLSSIPHRPLEEVPRVQSPLGTMTGALGSGENEEEEQDEETPTGVAHEVTSSSYFTGREWRPASTTTDNTSTRNKKSANQTPPAALRRKQTLGAPSQCDLGQSFSTAAASDSGSETPLLRPESRTKGKAKGRQTTSASLEQQEPQCESADEGEALECERNMWQDPLSHFSTVATRYTLDDNLMDKQQRLLSRISETRSMIPEWLHRRKLQEGEVIKAEKMLVRVEETIKDDLPEDYSEFDSLRMECRVQDNWKEFLVACRTTPDKSVPFVLDMYKTRVIPEVHVQKTEQKVSPYHEIPLGKAKAKVNLYSSLDKTIVIWNRCKRGTRVYILRPKSTAHAVEWYSFITHALGWRRPSSLLINVPDLDVSIIFQNPFVPSSTGHPEKQHDCAAPSRPAEVERLAGPSIIRGCMEILQKHPEWANILKEWSNFESMGLVWKHYDRLEWVFGVNEEKLYGSLAMQGTHELELRPRQHYSTFINHGNGKEEEPEPIEGFLIRLTSQKGVHQRMNRVFFKRLYFFCHDHYLLFCKPSKALPPSPPKLCPAESTVPSTQEILDEMPLSYEIDPFPIQDGQIPWLSNGNVNHLQRHDEQAYTEFCRNIHNLSHSEGFIDMCRVQEVRQVCDTSAVSQTGPRVGETQFHSSDANNHRRRDRQLEYYKAFEILLDNGLVARFQAFNEATRDEWMKRLGALVKYWKLRTAADAAELKAIRQRNLELLDIDQEQESMIGQFAKKWEVKKAEASPLLHNLCTLSGCRPIKMSGQLYKKPRRHGTFERCRVVLTSGKLLIYESSLRKRSGAEIPHIHHRLESILELDNCYIYSGLLTESDLLYANQTFDSNHPGHHGLPRVYLSSDLYTSNDEDTAITFVIWQPLRSNYFRARELGGKGKLRQSLKQVSKLGVHGRTIVFKARSRLEKDRWVLSIASEIDRLQESKPEDIRLTTTG